MYHDSTSTKVIVVAMQQILGCNVGWQWNGAVPSFSLITTEAYLKREGDPACTRFFQTKDSVAEKTNDLGTDSQSVRHCYQQYCTRLGDHTQTTNDYS